MGIATRRESPTVSYAGVYSEIKKEPHPVWTKLSHL